MKKKLKGGWDNEESKEYKRLIDLIITKQIHITCEDDLIKLGIKQEEIKRLQSLSLIKFNKQ